MNRAERLYQLKLNRKELREVNSSINRTINTWSSQSYENLTANSVNGFDKRICSKTQLDKIPDPTTHNEETSDEADN